MAVLTATAAKGKPYFEGTSTLYLTHDNSSDNFVAGVYSHNALEASATEWDIDLSLILYLMQVFRNGGGAFTVYNNTGSTLLAGPVAITGHQGTDANGQPIFQIKGAGNTGNGYVMANALLLASLANVTQGTAYLGGTYTPGTPVDATAAVATISCNTTNTSQNVTIANNAGLDGTTNPGTDLLEVGQAVTGTGIPASTTVLSITDRYTFTISNAATATGTASLTFKGAVGTCVYLGTSGQCTLIRPLGTDQITQIVGRLQTATSNAIVDGFIESPIRYGTSALQDGAAALQKLSTGARVWGNLLINGGFDFFERLTTKTALTAAAAYGGYVPDRWYLTGETLANDQQAAQVDESGTSGFSSNNSCNVKNNNAGTKRIAISQVVESINAIPMRGRNVTFQFKFRPSTSRNVRAAIISAQSSSTHDSFTAAQRDVVNTWASGTYTTGNFFKSTSGVWTYTVVAVSPSLAGTSVTWSALQSLQGSVPNDCQNLICIVWDDAGAPTGESFRVTQMGLFDGQAVRDWLPRPQAHEKLLCQRYGVRKASDKSSSSYAQGLAGLASRADIGVVMPVSLFQPPTSIAVTGTPGTDFQISNSNAAFGTISSFSLAASLSSREIAFIQITMTASPLTIGNSYILAASTTNGALFFEAEM